MSALVKCMWDVWCAVYISIGVCVYVRQTVEPSVKKIKISSAHIKCDSAGWRWYASFYTSNTLFEVFPTYFYVCANVSVCITSFVCWIFGMWGYPYRVDASQNLAEMFTGKMVVGMWRRFNKNEVQKACRHRTSLISNRIRSDDITSKYCLYF